MDTTGISFISKLKNYGYTNNLLLFLSRCEGTECGDNDSDERYEGVCDKDGCDFASYRLGDTDFYGPGSSFTIDTEQPVTVVTQFLTDDGTDQGNLVEVRRLYVQNGQVIQNSFVEIDGVEAYDSITDEFCADVKEVFGDVNDHEIKGGLTVSFSLHLLLLLHLTTVFCFL